MHFTKPIESRYPKRRGFDFPVRCEERRPTPADFGLDVTVCIAAATKSGMADGHIVTVSDRMISAPDDTVQGTEALKSRMISKTWALMFAGDGNLFLPIVKEVSKQLGEFKKAYDFQTIQSTVSEVYKSMFSEFSSGYLSRYGLSGISEFRSSGLSHFGEKFYEICQAIDKYDLGMELLGYGFDPDGSPHIFDVLNPGIVTNHDLLGYSVIGSGSYMATASLRRRKIPYDRKSVAYRLLEAKFSAETASGVGESTTLFTMSPEGKTKSIGCGSMSKIKDIGVAGTQGSH